MYFSVLFKLIKIFELLCFLKRKLKRNYIVSGYVMINLEVRGSLLFLEADVNCQFEFRTEFLELCIFK